MSTSPRIDRHEIVVISLHSATGAPSLNNSPAPGAGYTNHIGTTRDGAGNIFAAVTLDGPGAGDLDVAIMKRQQGSGVWTEIHRFTEAQYNKHGYGSLEVVGNHLVCVLSERSADGATVAVEYRIYDVAVCWPGCVA